MGKPKLPKKVLRVKNLTFILPDDFDGDIQKAFMLLTAYLINEFNTGGFNPDCSKNNGSNPNISSVLDDNIDEKCKVSMQYGIFEMDDNGNYMLK